MRRPWKSKKERPLNSQEPSEKEYRMKLLYDAENCDVDIVAVHGLCESRSATWTAENGFNWLSDFLPSHIPTARVFTYGYDSTAHSSQHIVQKILFLRAKKLIASFDMLRRESHSERRPIIFAAHSLGGILVKSALIQSEWAKISEEKHLYAIKQTTSGIVFFGTPHHGTSTVSWRNLLENVVAVKKTTIPTFKFLEKDSEWLEIQTEQYKSISRHFSSYNCYETRSSPSLCVSVPLPFVPRKTACPNEYARDGQRCVALDLDHCNLCKFENDSDPNYEAVLNCFRSIYQQRYLVVERWESHGCGSNPELPLDILQINDDYSPRTILPYDRNTHFVGREAQLAEIHTSLCSARAVDQRRPVVLYGVGGIGKTQVALEYAYRYMKDFSSIFWLDARDHGSMQASLLAIVQNLVDHYKTQFQAAEQPSFQASRYLGLKAILDENGRIIPDHGSSKIIGEAIVDWLSRQNNGRWLLIIDALDDDTEAYVSELLSHIPWGRRLYTSRLRIRVQCLQASRLTSLTVRESMQLFSTHSGKPVESGDKHGILTARQCLADLPQQIAQAREFAKVVSATRGIHWESLPVPLRAEWHGATRQVYEQRQAYCDALPDEIKDRPITDPMSIMSTLDLAASHLKHANYKQAKSLYTKLLMMVEEKQGPNSPDALRLVEQLANTYQRSGQLEQSQMLFERQLLAVEDQYGHDSPVSRSVLRDLVQACELFGHYNRAGQLVRRQMLADRERLGSEHPTVLRSLGHLAVLADEQGHIEKSDALFSQAISGFENVYGGCHTVTLNAYENLAMSYRLRGRFDEAEHLLRRSLQIRRRNLYERSELLRTVERLTAIFEEWGKSEDARKIRQEFPEQCARDMCAISSNHI